MKPFTSVFAIILLLAIALSGCKKDSKEETKSNKLKIGDSEYALSQGYLYFYGGDGSMFDFDLVLLSPGITMYKSNGTLDSLVGTGQYIIFRMISSGTGRLTPGDYGYTTPTQAWGPGTFHEANYLLTYNAQLQHNPNFTEITGGTVKIIDSEVNSPYNLSNQGMQYELSYSGNDEFNKNISLYFKGRLDFFVALIDKK
jgi:hypothetical protein